MPPDPYACRRRPSDRCDRHGAAGHCGEVTALDDFTADVAPGRITAFLGPNGSGKTTSMRLLLGLAEPTHGSALIGGRAYASLKRPLRIVSAVLDQGFHPNRSARNHLRIAAMQAGVPESRVDDVLDVVELTSVPGDGARSDVRVRARSVPGRSRIG
jgi:ABC-2 type transport system ATP-binding protein